MNQIQNQLINLLQFDKTSLTVHYRLQDGIAGNYKIRMVDEKTNGYFYDSVIYLIPNVTYWTSCGEHAIKNYIHQNVKIIFEFDNKVVFENSYLVNDNIRESVISNLYFRDTPVNINTYMESLLFNTYSQFGIAVEQNDTVVDIGSNVGAFIRLALNNKCKQIYCCEPNPSCIDIIRKNYGEHKNLIVEQYAISNSIGFSELMIPSIDNAAGTAKLTQSTVSTNTDYSKCEFIQIKTITFKDFIIKNNISKIDFLKVDCEGGEEFIFNESNIEYIKNNVYKIVMEYHNNKKDYINYLLKSVGFETYVVPSSDQLGMIYAKNKN